jgi:hypothetical protein
MTDGVDRTAAHGRAALIGQIMECSPALYGWLVWGTEDAGRVPRLARCSVAELRRIAAALRVMAHAAAEAELAAEPSAPHEEG